MARKGRSGKNGGGDGNGKSSDWAFRRRDFLKLTTAAGAPALGVGAAGCDLFPLILNPDFSATLTRREDLVSLRFEFVNLKLQNAAGGGQELVPKGMGASYLVVHFQPQHIFEESLEETMAPPPPPLEKPVDARIAGPSRVVLKVPSDKTPIPFTGEGLLGALASCEMNVAPNALPPDPPLIVAPLPGPGPIIGPITGLGLGLGGPGSAETIDVRDIARTRQLMAAGRLLSVSSGIDVSVLPASSASPDGVGTSPGPQAPQPPMFPLPPGTRLPPGVGGIIDAIVRPKPRPRFPADGETALELPYRLILSPNKSGGWAHSESAAQGLKQGRHELWHTRLGVRSAATGNVSEKPSYLRTVRAIWSRDDLFDAADPSTYDDYSKGTNVSAYDDFFNEGPDFELHAPKAMSHADRVEAVHLSSNFRDLPPSYKPKAIDANRLMLTTLGGWLDAHGDFTINTPLNLVSWDHKAALGRDYYVKIERKGRLYPWGHFSIKVKITERKFRSPDLRTAYLWTRQFILIREPIRDYPDSWRKFPFKSIHVKTTTTPNLSGVPDGPTPTAIQIDPSTPFRFKMEGVDREGNVCKFDAPATWVPADGIANNVDLVSLRNGGPPGAADLYDAYGDHRIIKLTGQRVAYSKNKKTDDTTYETDEMLIDGTVEGEQPSMVPFPSFGINGTSYAPGVAEAKINVEAIRHLVGQDEPTPFQYHLTYLRHGFPAPGDMSHQNKGELLFQVKEGLPPIGLNFAKKSDASGGFVAPSLDISGISRKTGPISGTNLADIANNKFDPKEFLKSVDAMIFGVIPLFDIIETIEDAAGGLDKAPNFVTQAADAVTGFMEDAAALKARLQEITDTAGTDTTAIRTKIGDIIAAINALFTAPDLTTAVANAQTLITELDGLLGAFMNTIDGLPTSILFSVREDLKRRIRSVRDVLGAVKAGLMAFASGLEMAKNLTVKLEWRAPLKGDDLGFFVPNPGGGFLLAVEARAKKVGDKPAGVDVIADIENFDVNVFGTSAKLVTIPFERLVFKVESGKKPDVDVVFRGDGIGFDGILAFVETLSKLIPSKGFSDPPAIEVDAEGIRSSFSVPIPSISVGVFSIQNISIGCGFEVPFIGNPLSVNFNFCTREEPFILTVLCIGGGGFFGMKLSPKGMLLLEAALEARAQLSLDLGVASGSVSIAVGVYFRLEEKGGKQEGSLTGYLRIQGCVDVLGLITASITLLLELIYEFSSEKLIGRATLTIEISICFFSFSVEVVCERRLAGSNNDPTFVDQMGEYMLPGELAPRKPWNEYCESFLLAA